MGAEQLREVVRRQADAALRQIEPELVAHRPRQPRIDPRRRRPDAFDQPAENDAIVLRQPRFERAVDPQRGAFEFGPAHGDVAERGLEHIGIVVRQHHHAAQRLDRREIVERHQQGRALRPLEGGGDVVVIARQRDQHGAVTLPEGAQIDRLGADALQRRQRGT